MLRCYAVIIRVAGSGRKQAKGVATKSGEINVEILHLGDIEGRREERSILREIEKVKVAIVRTCIEKVYVNISVAGGLRKTKLGHQIKRKGSGITITIAHSGGVGRRWW